MWSELPYARSACARKARGTDSAGGDRRDARTNVAFLGVIEDLQLLKKSFLNEGTASLATNAVGIGRQSERGADGYSAVGGVGRVVGAGRAVCCRSGSGGFAIPAASG